MSVESREFTGAKIEETLYRRARLAAIYGFSRYPAHFNLRYETTMRNDYEYEVFKGKPNEKIIRLGAVKDCERATQLMYRMYARLPGDYFIRHISTREVVCSVEAANGKSFGPTHFDIFRGLPDKNAVWVDTVEGLAAAREKMEEIARATPGKYFLFSRIDHSILGYAEHDAAESPRGESRPGTAA